MESFAPKRLTFLVLLLLSFLANNLVSSSDNVPLDQEIQDPPPLPSENHHEPPSAGFAKRPPHPIGYDGVPEEETWDSFDHLLAEDHLHPHTHEDEDDSVRYSRMEELYRRRYGINMEDGKDQHDPADDGIHSQQEFPGGQIPHPTQQPIRESTPYFKPPRFSHLRWVHSNISHAHAILCMVLYAGLILKIRRERTSVGLSFQSISALFLSEAMSFLIRAFEFRRARHFDFSILYTDFASTVLAGWCAYSVKAKFNVARDDQLDTFGLNIINWLYINFFTLPMCPDFGTGNVGNLSTKHGKNRKSVAMCYVRSTDGMTSVLDVNSEILAHNNLHLGQIRPIGFLGNLCMRLYWLVLYLGLALPLTIAFMIAKLLMPYGSLVSRSPVVGALIAAGDGIRSVALIPQLYMYELKQTKRISEQLLLFVACEGLLKFLAIAYWSTHSLFHYSSPASNFTRYYAVGVQTINFLIIIRIMSGLLNPSTRSTAIERSSEMAIPLQEPSPTSFRPEMPVPRNRSAISAATKPIFS